MTTFRIGDVVRWLDRVPERRVTGLGENTCHVRLDETVWEFASELTLLRRPLLPGDRFTHPESEAPVARVATEGDSRHARVFAKYGWTHESGVAIDVPEAPAAEPPKETRTVVGWVVREGKVRGEGGYLQDMLGRCTCLECTPQPWGPRASAYVYRHRPAYDAASFAGRVVRKVKP